MALQIPETTHTHTDICTSSCFTYVVRTLSVTSFSLLLITLSNTIDFTLLTYRGPGNLFHSHNSKQPHVRNEEGQAQLRNTFSLFWQSKKDLQKWGRKHEENCNSGQDKIMITFVEAHYPLLYFLWITWLWKNHHYVRTFVKKVCFKRSRLRVIKLGKPSEYYHSISDVCR